MPNVKLESFLDSMDKELDAVSKSVKTREVQESMNMEEYMEQLMINASTISCTYDVRTEQAEIYSDIDGMKKTVKFDITGDEYDKVCEQYCDNVKDQFNHSNWFMNKYGDLVRVFTNLPPVTPHPLITINVSRAIKDFSLSEYDEKLRMLVPFCMANRTLICGQTGSGKTYFLNRALKNTFSGKWDKGMKFNVDMKAGQGGKGGGDYRIPKNISRNRIALVEEFHEVFPPNENTIVLNACPVKPGQTNIFAYVVQQTNLMRLDNIIVGELKGEETFYFMNNASSGIASIATCHGKSCLDALHRMKQLCVMSGHCNLDQAGTIVSQAIDFVIYIDHHKIKEIIRLCGGYNPTTQKFQTDSLYQG